MYACYKLLKLLFILQQHRHKHNPSRKKQFVSIDDHMAALLEVVMTI